MSGEKKRVWRSHSIHNNFRDFVDRLLQYSPEERLGVKGLSELKAQGRLVRTEERRKTRSGCRAAVLVVKR